MVGVVRQDQASKRRLGVRKIPYHACPFSLGVSGGAGAEEVGEEYEQKKRKEVLRLALKVMAENT